METFTTFSMLLFDAFRIFEMLVSSSRVSDRMSPNSIFCVAGLIGAWPATNTNPPDTTACDYGPSGLGNSGDETTRLPDRAAAASAIEHERSPVACTVAHALLRATSAIVPTPGKCAAKTCRERSRHGTNECDA